MTEAEKLRRDIDALRESIRLDWADLAHLGLSPEERAGIHEHVNMCIQDLNALLAQLNTLNAKGS